MCTQCGNELQRDDARFCSNCGAPVVASSFNTGLPLSPVKTPPQRSSESQVPRQEHRHVLREQIAHQPRPARLTRDISSENASLPGPFPQSTGHERPELRVRIWDQEQKSKPAQANTSIEDLPTQETPASPMTPPSIVSQPVQRRTASLEQEQARLRELIAQQRSQAIEDLPTTEHASPVFPTVPPTPVLPRVPSPPPATPVPPAMFEPEAPVAPVLAAPTRVSTLSSHIPSRDVRRGPVPLVLLGVIILVLLVAGVAWIRIVQPFTVPSITNPLQSYRDTHLGIALSYPTDWLITHSASSVQFSDSSQTAQAAIHVLSPDNAPSANVKAYLQAQATKLGMTGAKMVTHTSFAGTSWQQIQGSVQINGVNETEALFATIHNNKLLVLTQLAPQNVYLSEDSVSFSKMRTSLQLL